MVHRAFVAVMAVAICMPSVVWAQAETAGAGAPPPAMAAAPAAPLVAYAVRDKLPKITEVTFGKAAAALAGFGAPSLLAAVVMGGTIGAATAYKPFTDRPSDGPAAIVAQDLAQAYAAAHGGSVVPDGIVTADDKIESLVAAARGTGFIVEAVTTRWGYQYYSADLSHFGGIYNVHVRLIDAATGKVVAEGRCGNTTRKPHPAPTRDQLLGDDALLLKQQLAESAHICAAKLKAETLKL